MDHSPRIEAEDVDDDNDDSDEDNDDKLYKKDLENTVCGTPPTPENQSPLPGGLNGVLEEMVKCVLVMEAWCPQMSQAFDNDGDHYSTQHHNHTKHDFPVSLMMICGRLMLKASRLMPILITSTNLPT